MKTLKDSDIFKKPEHQEPDSYEERQTVKIIVQNEEEEIALITNPIHNFFLLPGGGAESNDLEKEAEREALEEINYFVKITKEVGKIEEFRNRNAKHLITTCFLAEPIKENREDLRTEEEKRKLYEVNSLSKYFIKNISNISLDRSFFENEPLYYERLGLYEAHIVTSRGCIYNCAFCGAALDLNKGTPIRIKSLESIQFEIDSICCKYPYVNSIRILDDLFIRGQSDVIKIEKIFAHRNIYWRSMTHILSFSKMTDNDLKRIKASGCLELFVGIESGSENILKKIGKCSNVNLIKDIIIRLMKVGFNLKTYFIYGLP